MNRRNRRNHFRYLAAASLLISLTVAWLRWYGSKPHDPQGGKKVSAPIGVAHSEIPETRGIENEFKKRFTLHELSADPGTQLEAERVISEMAAPDLVRTLEAIWLEEPEKSKVDLALQLLHLLAKNDPHAAAAWIAARPESRTQIDGVKAVAATWASSDPTAAGLWVRQLTGDQKVAGVVTVGYESASSKPAEAIWLASELPPGPQRDDLIEYVIREWVAVDTNAPLSWAKKLTEPSMREQVLASAAVSLGDTDPVAAATLAVEQVPPGKRQNDAVVGIVQRWAQQDARKAADWVLTFPVGPLRNQALQNLVHQWASKSLEEPAIWLNELENGEARDVAISAYSEMVASTAPRKAITWAETISDPQQRQRQIDLIKDQWVLEGKLGRPNIDYPVERTN